MVSIFINAIIHHKRGEQTQTRIAVKDVLYKKLDKKFSDFQIGWPDPGAAAVRGPEGPEASPQGAGGGRGQAEADLQWQPAPAQGEDIMWRI